MKNTKSFDKNSLIIFIISLVLMIPLINNLYLEGYNTGYRIANNFEYGSGIFYPQLSHIQDTIFYLFDISVFTSMKITKNSLL